MYTVCVCVCVYVCVRVRVRVRVCVCVFVFTSCYQMLFSCIRTSLLHVHYYSKANNAQKWFVLGSNFF